MTAADLDHGVARHVDGETLVYVCVGHPTRHMRAAAAFNAVFAARGINAVTVLADVEPANLEAFITGLRGWRNLIGIGVTIPHKESIVHMLDELHPTAALSRSVNTIRRLPAGRLRGASFDGSGFVKGLENAGLRPAGLRGFVAGAGGAGRAISFALLDAGMTEIDIANRTAPRLQTLIADLRVAFPNARIGALDNPTSAHTLAVNATSLGMHAGDALPIDLGQLPRTAVVAEVVMSPEVTPLLLEANKRGLAVHLGREMRDPQLDECLTFLGFD